MATTERRPAVPAAGNGHTPAEAKGTVGHFEHRGRLPTFKLGSGEQMNYFLYHLRGVTCRDDVGHRLVMLDQPFENIVEDIVGGQRILIHLVGA